MFFMLRSLSLQLQGELETQLPLTRPEDLIKTDDVLDLSKTHRETEVYCTLNVSHKSNISSALKTRPQATGHLMCLFMYHFYT